MGWSLIGMGGMLLAGIEKQYFILTTWLGVCRICLSMNSVFDRLPCNYSVSVKTKVRPVATAWKLILLDVVSVSRRSMARLGTHRWTSVRRIPDTYLLTTGAVFRSIGKLAILLGCLSVSRTATGVWRIWYGRCIMKKWTAFCVPALVTFLRWGCRPPPSDGGVSEVAKTNRENT